MVDAEKTIKTTRIGCFRPSEPAERRFRGCGDDLLGHHHAVELLVVDLSVAVDVGLLDHGVDLVGGELLAQVHHDHGQLLAVDVAVTILGQRQRTSLVTCTPGETHLKSQFNDKSFCSFTEGEDNLILDLMDQQTNIYIAARF